MLYHAILSHTLMHFYAHRIGKEDDEFLRTEKMPATRVDQIMLAYKLSIK